MANISPVETRDAGRSQPLLDTVHRKLGTIPNLLATMAHAPAALEFYLAAGTAFDKGALDGPLREKIALTVAGESKCDYCASAHTFIGRSLGIGEAEASRNLAGESSDPRTQAILRFARAVVRDRALTVDNASEVNRLRADGVTDEEIIENVANVAFNICTNYVNHIADTDIDFPPVRTDADLAEAS